MFSNSSGTYTVPGFCWEVLNYSFNIHESKLDHLSLLQHADDAIVIFFLGYEAFVCARAHGAYLICTHFIQPPKHWWTVDVCCPQSPELLINLRNFAFCLDEQRCSLRVCAEQWTVASGKDWGGSLSLKGSLKICLSARLSTIKINWFKNNMVSLKQKKVEKNKCSENKKIEKGPSNLLKRYNEH